MSLLPIVLIVNAIDHAIIVARYGRGNHNEPFLVFAVIYAALAVAVQLAVPHALWAVLILSIAGIVGLMVTFKKPVRDKTIDKLIWLLDAATILYTGYLLFAA